MGSPTHLQKLVSDDKKSYFFDRKNYFFDCFICLIVFICLKSDSFFFDHKIPIFLIGKIFFFGFSIPLCKLLNQHLTSLARKFPQTKFLRSVSELCIDNYPDKNLPTVFVYKEGAMQKQWVGPHEFGGMNLTVESE